LQILQQKTEDKKTKKNRLLENGFGGYWYIGKAELILPVRLAGKKGKMKTADEEHKESGQDDVDLEGYQIHNLDTGETNDIRSFSQENTTNSAYPVPFNDNSSFPSEPSVPVTHPSNTRKVRIPS
jgi:hypothetical protein